MTTVADLVYQLGGLPTLPAGIPVGPVGSNYFFVDGTNGADGNAGSSPNRAFATIQRAFTVNGGSPGALVIVLPKKMAVTDTDPNSYAETVIVDAPSSMLLGVSRGRTQGGLPQIKIGTGSTSMITVRAPGCMIAGIGINGASSTGNGILLDDDGGATKSAFGTTVTGCHFKNCAPSATLASAGGAIAWSSAGNAWQVMIAKNTFYKNTADVCLIGTSGSVPQDVVIENNYFSGPGASVSANLYLAGGSGINGVSIQRNVFPCQPAAGGTNEPVNLTGCVGILAWNSFGTNGKTYGAAANVLVPTTVAMCGNYQDGALIART